MALTRLDNLISSKTGKYLYVSPDDFNASDELNNRGNSPVRPFKSIQRAYIEIARYSYLPGTDNDRFDQFTIMLMPGKHYIDNRPGLLGTDGIDAFQFDQALGEWVDNSNLDIGDPDNCLYKFNNTEGGAIIPRGSSMIGYDLRRTSVHPLFVPDPADRLEKRSAIFNVTGGCYFWQMTIRDGDLEPSSPLYDSNEGVGKVYNQTPAPGTNDWGSDKLEIPNFSHHKLTVFEYADKEELGLYYRKVAKAFSQYQPNIDNPNEFGDRIQETRIVGPLSDIRSIESIKLDDATSIPSLPASTTQVTVTTKVDHGYFKNQFIAIENNALDDEVNGTFSIDEIDQNDSRVFRYRIEGVVSSLGTNQSLVAGTIYDVNSSPVALGQNAAVKAEVDSVESASPYVFNCSIRSTWGICGIWANGLKATGFKSMVIAQYTGVSLQKDDRAFIRYDEYTNTFNQASLKDAFATVAYHTKGDAFWKDDWRNFHVRASEDAFIQCVSIFAVGFADHFLMESGGDMSITNSNSNFGNTSLHAKGHKGYAFNQDKGGYIDAIIPPETVTETVGNTKRNSYYTLDVQKSNDASNHTKLFLGDDEGYDPTKRPAATIGGYRIGAKSDEKIFVKLTPNSAGDPTEFHSTVTPNGFKKFVATPSILNPTGVTVNNKDLDAANLIEANRDFIAYEAYGYITSKYPALLVKGNIDIVKCRRDIGYLLDATVQDLRLGGNINTIQAAESYYVQSGGTSNLSYIDGEKAETLEGYDYARDLAVAALRNFSYYRKGVETTAGNAIIKVGDSTGIVPGMLVEDFSPSDFTDNELNANAVSPNAVIPANTFVKRIIDSTTIELGQKATSSVKQVFSDRHGNANELILANKTFIATEAYERMLLDFPNYAPSAGYTAVTGKAKCIDDLEKAIEAIAENTGFGGNADTWDAAYYYDSGSVVDLVAKKDETIRAFNYCKDMAIQVMRKEDVFIFGTHGLTQSSVTASDPITSVESELVNDRNGDARDLILANKQLIAHEAVDRMILSSSTQQFTPTGAVYTASTGELQLTMANHQLSSADSHSIDNASYDAVTGIMTVTVNGHSFANGEKVKFVDNSITFTCTMDGGATQHTYPRPTDPVSGKWLTIFESDTSNNTFKVNVGSSPVVAFTPTTADYNPSTGLMTLKIGNHGLTAGTSVRITPESLGFTCDQDSNATTKYYPRSTDPFYNKSFEIESATADTITVQVLSTIPSTNVTAHTFVGVNDKLTITGATYTASTGVMVATIAGHGLETGDRIKIANSSIMFTCAMDGGSSPKSYPRPSDPVSNKWLNVTKVDADTLSINVGASPEVQYTPSNVAYNPTTGVMEMTIGAHGLDVGDAIKIADNSLTFTCAEDNHQSTHTYPRSSDPTSNTAVEIIGTTSTTISVQVLNSQPSTNTSEHKFVSAGTNAVTTGGDYVHTFATATPNGVTRAIVATGGDYQHTFVTAAGQGLKRSIDQVRFDYNAFTFECDMDNRATQHTYPRIGDPAAYSVLPIASSTADTITVDVGKTLSGTHDVSWADYNPNTGDMVLTIGSHNLKKGTSIKLDDNSLTFKCAQDNFVSPHTYPRPGTDPYAGTAIEITDVGSSYHTATDADYNPANGIIEIKVPNHGFANGDKIQISDGALTFTCGMDNNASEHSYPRSSDPKSGEWLTISDVTVDTFSVNVEPAGSNSTYTPTSGAYDSASGELTLTIGTHTLAVGDGIVIDDNSLSFTCTMDNNDSTKTYPRTNKDNASSRSISIVSKTDTTITVNVGNAGNNRYYQPTAGSYDAATGDLTLNLGQHGLAVGSNVVLKDNSLTFSCAKDGNTTNHTYPRPGVDPKAGKSLDITAVASTDHTATGAVYNPNTGDLTITVPSHGFTGPQEYTALASGTLYDPVSGVLTLNIPNHGLQNGEYIRIKDGALTFTCAKDNDGSTHTYPRATDPASNKELVVSNVTQSTLEVNIGVSSNTSAHTCTAVVGSSVTAGGDYIQIADNSLSFKCDLDGNTVAKSYPRTGFDYPSGRWLQVRSKTANDFTVNVGKSSNLSSHTANVAGFVADGIKHQSGNVTVNVGFDSDSNNQYAHTFVSAIAEAVEFVPQSVHAWVGAVANCVKHLPQSAHTFKRGSTGGILKQAGTITINVGVAAPADRYAHAFQGATAGAVLTGGNYTHYWVSSKASSVHKVFSVAGNLTYHDQDCVDDVVDLLEAIADNVAYGGNDKTWDAAYSYKTGAHVAGEEAETNIVFNHAKEMAGQVIKNQKILVTGHHGLHQIYDTTITDAAPLADAPVDKNGDAYNLILNNADLIAHEAYARMILEFPGFTPPTGNPQDCKDDIRDFVVEIAHNVGFGGNDRVWDMANLYVTGAHVVGEEDQTIKAFTDAKELMVQVIRNEKVLIIGNHGYTQTYDTVVTTDSQTPQDNKVADARNLIAANKNFISEIALGRMLDQYSNYTPSIGYTTTDCLDDIKDVVDVVAHNLAYGGNDRVWDTANMYVSGGHANGHENETIFAFNALRDLINQVMTNETVVTGSHTSLTQSFDNTITADTNSPKCPNQRATVQTLIAILTSTISTPSSLKGVDRVESVTKCENVRAVINTLSDIAINAISNPESLVGLTKTATNAVYDAASGDIEITIGSGHSLEVGSTVKISDNSLSFTCTMDGGTSVKSYPRSTDPVSGSAIQVKSVTDSTITVNVGEADTSVDYTPTDGSYNPTTGRLTLTIGAHPLTVGTAVKLATESIRFKCSKDGYVDAKAYPRATDPAHDTAVDIVAVTDSTITLDVGTTSDVSTHQWDGADANAVITGGNYVHTFSSAVAGGIQIGGLTRTPSSGKCEDIRSTINTLFGIVTSTVANGTALDSISRNISNGPCQNVASTITTLFGIITNTIGTSGYLDTIDKVEVPLGVAFGPSVNASTTTTDSYLWFSWPTIGGIPFPGVYTGERPVIDDSFNIAAANSVRRDTNYPECATQATAVRQYFANINTIIQSGLNSVPRNEPGSSSDLSTRATIWTLTDPSKQPPNQSDPHKFETGTAVRLVPRPKAGLTVDKRNVRLPNGFSTNQKYYIIAPGRSTYPKNYAATTSFDGDEQDVLMLASSKENAAAGIYLHSAEVEGIHPDVEIDLYQFTLDDKYDCHQYACTLVANGLQTDVAHIFDKPVSNVPEGHPVFFRANEGGALPKPGGTAASDPNVTFQGGGPQNGRIRRDVVFYARYVDAKTFKIYRTHADAINQSQEIEFASGAGFSVFANKRTSPMRFDPTVDYGPGVDFFGKWYIQVEPNSQGAPSNSQEILKRLHDPEYNSASGQNKTNDSWYTRLNDDRDPNDRIYRFRYVIPKYLKSVRDPLNGFTIKMRKDETRKLPPQKIILKPVSGSVTKAKFYNTTDSGQANEVIGWDKATFANPGGNQSALDTSKAYDPYRKDITNSGFEYQQYIRTDSAIQATIQSGRYFIDAASGDELLELTVFDHGIDTQVPALKNETLVSVKITAPQGGSFISNTGQPANGYHLDTKVEWDGNDKGSGFIHAALNVPGTTEWHLILKGITGTLDYSSIEDTRFTQTQSSAVVFADQLADPDDGKSLVLKEMIRKGYPQYYYRQLGTPVYTLTPGDEITDGAGVKFYIASVTDIGEIDDTFYVFDVEEIQKRIFEQQDGIFYITAVRGNISPYPTGAGNLNNFRDFKFSQPISKLYPLNYKNDPVWFKQLDPNFVDPPATYSAADNYVHGLVTVNDFKGSITKEAILDFIETPALSLNAYTGSNEIKAQPGNATSGSEDRQIPIAGDNTVVVDQRLYVELRRPSIARAGNHTFEYLGFGPGNYSTGLPIRQEVLLTSTQDFYAQSKKEDGGLVFYTGLNSNGDLYIGNRKIDAITGEEVFLERASLTDSADEDDEIGNLVTTFDTPVTFNQNITVNGGDEGKLTNTFNSPVSINILSTLDSKDYKALTILSAVNPNAAPVGEDATLDRSSQQKNTETRGDIVLYKNKIAASIFQFNPRGSNGAAQSYKIQNHVVGTAGSNITPAQSPNAKDYFDPSQIVRYGTTGPSPIPGDMLLKGDSVGNSGSLGWIYANTYEVLDDNSTGSPDAIFNIEFDGSQLIKINWKNSKKNKEFSPKITSASKIRIDNFSNPAFDGVHPIDPSSYDEDNDWIKVDISVSIGAVNGQNPRLWADETNATMEYSNTSWKEWGVLGSEAIRTWTAALGDYRVGINTTARSRNTDAWKTAFVNGSTSPKANLDVDGNAIITGYDIDYSTGVLSANEHALVVGTQTVNNLDDFATLHVTANSNKVGINTWGPGAVWTAVLGQVNPLMTHDFTVIGTGRFSDDVTFDQDIAINGNEGVSPAASNTAEIRTGISDGTFEFLMGTNFVGGFSSTTGGTRGLLMAGSAKNIELGNVQTAEQDIKIGNTAAKSWINIGDTADGDGTNNHISRLTLGGAYASTETDSFTQIDNKSLKIAGDVQLGTRRGLLDTVKLTSTAGTVEFFSGSSATNTLKFATNASELVVAGQGGKTTVRNNLVVDSTIRSNGDITLCGGLNAFSFKAERKQAGSTSMLSHDSGVLGNNLFNKNVDIIDVLRLIAPTGNPTKSDYNRIDTAGAGNWGDATWSNAIASASLPDLPTGQFYLPLKYSPYHNVTTLNPAGEPYFAENDILLIDTAETGTTHAEFVKIVALPRINTAPYYVTVERLPFGTYTTTSTQHADTTDVFKCVVQYDSTWLTSAIDQNAGEKDINLAQFGGGIDVGDYVILSREDGTPANDGIDDQGEIFKLTSVVSAVSKKLSVKKGCDTNSEKTVFEVDSVTGDVTIGDGNEDTTLTIKGSVDVVGKCGATSLTYPPIDATLDDYFTISNSDVDIFKTNICSGDTTIGSRYGNVFVKGGYFSSTPLLHDSNSEVISYVFDEQTKQATGPITTIATGITASDWNIPIAGNLEAFSEGDLIAVYQGDQAIEVMLVTDDPYQSGGVNYLPTIYNAAYPAGTYPTGGRGQEGTTVRDWNAGVVVVKIHKYSDTTTLLDSIPATGRTAVESPNNDPSRIRLKLANADIVPDKLDYTHLMRIVSGGASEWFYPDSIDGNVDSAYGIRLSKSTRYDATTGQFNANGVHTRFFGGGKLTVHDDIEIFSGNLRMYGSDGKTLIFNVANDDDHNGDESVRDEKTGYMGLFIGGVLQTKGNLMVQHGTCQTNGQCSTDTKFEVFSADGSVDMGAKLYIKGQVATQGSSSTEIFHIDNLGSAGNNTVGPKDFTIYQDSSIDAFGISRYWTRNGGRRYTYVEQSLTGLGQTQANPLQANNNYLVNTASATNIVVYLPEDAETGDMIRFVEVSGNLSYNASLVIRALKINNQSTAIQGDLTGTKIQAGAGQMATAWDSGELVVQTRNASFGLIYVGPSDAAGDPNASSIPSNLRGWWLTEL